MNYIVTAKSVYHPISLVRPPLRPVVPVAEDADPRHDRERQSPSFVYRGELLETAGDKSYRPRHNLQISPENRRAIHSYQKVVEEPTVLGKILDGFI